MSAVPAERLQRAIAAVALTAAGAVTGLAAVVAHARWWGLALAVAATMAALVALPDRLGARGVFVLGWVALVGLALWGRPEGDYAVASNAQGYALLALALAVAITGLVSVARFGNGSGSVTKERENSGGES